MGKIAAFLFIFGGIIFGSYLADWGLGDNTGYTIGFVVGVITYFMFMGWYRRNTGMGRASKEEIVRARQSLEENRVKALKLQEEQRLQAVKEHKECPYCAETIKAKAIKCRYCGSELTS